MSKKSQSRKASKEACEHCMTCSCRILSCPSRINSAPQDASKVEMVTNVDGESVVKGSEKDDRWGPYGTQISHRE